MPTSEETVIDKIKKIHSDAADFKVQEVGHPFIGGQTYYVEFSSKGVDPDEAFFYAFCDRAGCTLYEDGMEVIKGLQERLDRRRSFWQRISDFDFTESVAAVIAILISLTFVGLLIFRPDAVGKEFLAIFSVIVGYYFGRTRPSG